MRLEIWSDIVCPWCGIANGNLNRALDVMGNPPEIEVIHRSFQLMPDFPPNLVKVCADILRDVKGMTNSQIEATGAHMSKLALEAGFSSYHMADNLVGNTSLAHQFLAYASSKGKHEPAWKLIFREYYENALSIWTVSELSLLAPQLGLDAHEAKSALDSEYFKVPVDADRAKAEALGVRSVPFLLLNGRKQLRAQSSAQLVEELAEFQAESRNGIRKF